MKKRSSYGGKTFKVEYILDDKHPLATCIYYIYMHLYIKNCKNKQRFIFISALTTQSLFVPWKEIFTAQESKSKLVSAYF